MILQSAAGLVAFICIAWALSEKRRLVSVRGVIQGVALQLLLGVILLRVEFFREVFLGLNKVILFLEESTRAGTSFAFGYLGGGPLPFEESVAGSSFILAFRALPLILIVSALSSLLFYWKVLPVVVKTFSKILEKALRLGGAEGLGVAANVFFGMVESPLIVRPYLSSMSRSELFTLMSCGMATIAGTVMALYASILSYLGPEVMGHILTASIISAPAAITISKIMVPQEEEPVSGELTSVDDAHNSMDAVSKGTVRGVELLINIVAMLIVLVALVHFANLILGLVPFWGSDPLTLQGIMGFFMAPVAWLMGIPWSEARVAGELLGVKTILNELLAYLNMSQLPEGALSQRSSIILTYALCGFANPGSLGIMIGGMGTMAPERRDEIVALGLRSIIAGTLATCMTGAVYALVGR